MSFFRHQSHHNKFTFNGQLNNHNCYYCNQIYFISHTHNSGKSKSRASRLFNLALSRFHDKYFRFSFSLFMKGSTSTFSGRMNCLCHPSETMSITLVSSRTRPILFGSFQYKYTIKYIMTISKRYQIGFDEPILLI